MKTSLKIKTGGDGLWSSEKREVKCVELALYICHLEDDNDLFGSFRVRFDVRSWDIRKHGLIYTDEKFLAGLKRELIKMGFKKKNLDIGYSEQGRQGTNFVDFDIGERFIADYINVFGSIKK